MKIPVLHPADQIFFWDPGGWMTPWTTWATQAKGEEKTLATHQARAYSCDYIVHAIGRGVVKEKALDVFMRAQNNGVQYCVMRRTPRYSIQEVHRFRYLCNVMCGEVYDENKVKRQWKYSWLYLKCCLLDSLAEKRFSLERRLHMGGVGPHGYLIWFRKAGQLKKYWVICSEAANFPDVEEKGLPEWAIFATPDDSLDMLENASEFGVNGKWVRTSDGTSPYWDEGYSRRMEEILRYA